MTVKKWLLFKKSGEGFRFLQPGSRAYTNADRYKYGRSFGTHLWSDDHK